MQKCISFGSLFENKTFLNIKVYLIIKFKKRLLAGFVLKLLDQSILKFNFLIKATLSLNQISQI